MLLNLMDLTEASHSSGQESVLGRELNDPVGLFIHYYKSSNENVLKNSLSPS